MDRTTTMERLAVVVLVLGLGLNEAFHTVIDGMEFGAVAAFVGDVISMQSTNDPESWRAIDSPAIATVAYASIWAAHAIGGVLCLIGSVRLMQALKASQSVFRERSVWVMSGLTVGAALYGIGFNAIASGWFNLWSAPKPPNYVSEAMQLLLVYVGALILLVLVVRREAGGK